MRYVLTVSHGEFANGLKNATEMLIGPQENLYTLGMLDGMGADKYVEKLTEICKSFDKNAQIILMADLAEGSPMTNALMVMDNLKLSDNMVAFAGMNLPMVITAAMLGNQDMDLDEVKSEIIEESKKQIKVMESSNEVEDEI